jgi:hypothetical protein
MARKSRRKSRNSEWSCDQPLRLMLFHNCASSAAMTRTLTALWSDQGKIEEQQIEV